MKQISSKINMHIRNINVINNNIERFTLNIVLWSLGVLALLYIVFLGNMVKNIVERQSLEASARSLSNEVSNLELNYLAISNNVDLNLSHFMGFKETKTVFATRKSFGLRSGVKIAQNDI